jgi:hypothetical protein
MWLRAIFVQVRKTLAVLIKHDLVQAGFAPSVEQKAASLAKASEVTAASKKRERREENEESKEDVEIDDLVRLVKHGSGPAHYAVRIPAILFRCHLAKCHPHVTKLEGIDAGLLMRVFCQHGKLTKQEAVDKAEEQLLQQDPNTPISESRRDGLITAVDELCGQRYVKRATTLDTALEVNIVAATAKRPKTDARFSSSLLTGDLPSGDEQIYWVLNPERFIIDFRDHEIATFIRARTNSTCGDIVGCMLASYPRTRAVPPVLDTKQVIRLSLESHF